MRSYVLYDVASPDNFSGCIAKFAHQVNIELLLDLFANLRALLALPNALSEAASLQHRDVWVESEHGPVEEVETVVKALSLPATYRFRRTRTV